MASASRLLSADRICVQAVQGGLPGGQQRRQGSGRKVQSSSGGIEMRHSSSGDSVAPAQQSPQRADSAAAGGRRQEAGTREAQAVAGRLHFGSEDAASPHLLGASR